jgi:hypothetical protein
VAIIAGLEQVLSKLRPGSFELGAGLKAAQQTYASAERTAVAGGSR